MSWFKKNKKEDESVSKLPDLPESDLNLPSLNDLNPRTPELPNLNELPDVSEELPPIETSPLPEIGYPISPPMNNSFMPTNYPKSFDAPAGFQRSQFPPLRQHSVQPSSPEIKEIVPKREKRTIEMPRTYAPPKTTQKSEPIFVRLDKFQETVSILDSIREKVIEIESMLSKTKQVKAQEERELEQWETEIRLIKSRIESIDQSVFSKLD